MEYALSVSFADSSPVAVPGIFVALEKASSSADRCHSLGSLHPPPAALASLPQRGSQFSLPLWGRCQPVRAAGEGEKRLLESAIDFRKMS